MERMGENKWAVEHRFVSPYFCPAVEEQRFSGSLPQTGSWTWKPARCYDRCDGGLLPVNKQCSPISSVAAASNPQRGTYILLRTRLECTLIWWPLVAAAPLSPLVTGCLLALGLGLGSCDSRS